MDAMENRGGGRADSRPFGLILALAVTGCIALAVAGAMTLAPVQPPPHRVSLDSGLWNSVAIAETGRECGWWAATATATGWEPW